MATKLVTFRQGKLDEMTPNLREQAKIYNEHVRLLRRTKRQLDQQVAAENQLYKFWQAEAKAREKGDKEWGYIEPMEKPEVEEILKPTPIKDGS